MRSCSPGAATGSRPAPDGNTASAWNGSWTGSWRWAEPPPRSALRKRYLAVRDSLFTFLEHPEAPPDNNGSERELRPMVVYRKVTGGFRSAWGPDLCAAVASVVGTAARRGIDAYHAIHAVLSGRTVLAPG